MISSALCLASTYRQRQPILPFLAHHITFHKKLKYAHGSHVIVLYYNQPYFVVGRYRSVLSKSYRVNWLLSLFPYLNRGVAIDLHCGVRWCVRWANCLLLGIIQLLMPITGSKISHYSFSVSFIIMLHLVWWLAGGFVLSTRTGVSPYRCSVVL